MGIDLEKSMTVIYPGNHVVAGVSWKENIEEGMKNANTVLNLLKRKFAIKVITFVKLGL